MFTKINAVQPRKEGSYAENVNKEVFFVVI